MQGVAQTNGDRELIATWVGGSRTFTVAVLELETDDRGGPSRGRHRWLGPSTAVSARAPSLPAHEGTVGSGVDQLAGQPELGGGMLDQGRGRRDDKAAVKENRRGDGLGGQEVERPPHVEGGHGGDEGAQVEHPNDRRQRPEPIAARSSASDGRAVIADDNAPATRGWATAFANR